MARLSILVSLLTALLFVAATAYKTTITTVEIDEEVSTRNYWRYEGPQGRCTQKLQSLDLRPCEQHVMERIRGQEEEEDVIRLRGVRVLKPRREPEGGDEQDLEQYCCKQLRELNDQKCQCQALQQIMERQSEKLEEREMQEMERELKRLPQKCGMGQLRGCDLSRMDH